MKKIILSGTVIILFGAYTFLIRSGDISAELSRSKPTPVELVNDAPKTPENNTTALDLPTTVTEKVTKNIDCVYIPYDQEVEESFLDDEEAEKEQKGYYKCTTIIVTPTKTTTILPKTTAPATTTPAVTTTPPPATKPKTVSVWKDGTFIGSSVDAIYGNVQVSVTISGGKLIGVTFLDYPRDRQTSLQKSNRAMPILKSEAIKSQSAKVNIVSSVTYTSKAFIKSLSSALTQATI